jgi:DnaJ-domain-containing protein 1
LIQLLVILALTLLIGLALQKILKGLPQGSGNSGSLRRGLIWAAILLGLALAATGRLGILIPLVGALIAAVLRVLPVLLPMLIQYVPLWQRWQQQQQGARQTAGGGGRSASGGSSVESRFLRMHLDHRSGQISGEILAGRYAGRRLADLSHEQLADFYRECRGDRESASLFEAYYERTYGETWTAEDDRGRDRDRGRQHHAPPSNGKMTTAEALEVLGLERGATRDDIVAAHRRLMQKLHPDRGGSDYLAAKINEAKAVLLG